MKKKLVEGAFGLKMIEETARSVDRLLKDIPSDHRRLIRKQSVAEVSEVQKSERTDVSTITTDSVDRDGEVVLPKGLCRKLYERNPVVMFAHDYARPPVGICLWMKDTANGVKAKTKYADRPQDHNVEWLPDVIFSLTVQGMLKGKSIGFIPTEMNAPSNEQIKSRPEWKNATAIISRSVLLEYSSCAIPVNQDALVEAVAKGLVDRHSLRLLGLLPAKKLRKVVDPVVEFAERLAQITISPERIIELMMQKYRV